MDKTVTSSEDYYFSSARNYESLENELDMGRIGIILTLPFLVGMIYKTV